MPPATLITIRWSHYCEKARWALDRAGSPYVEHAYKPGAHRAATAPHGGTSVPVLVVPDQVVLKDSTDIVRWADAGVPVAARLFPDGADGDAVAALVARFDDVLGPATRALAYIHTLADDDSELATRMKRAMRLDEEGAEDRARRAIDGVFADVEQMLGDGRRFLHGGRFTAADLTFASLAAPAVDLADVKQGPATPLPDGLAAIRRAYRATPVGEFCARLYREERGVHGAAAVQG